MTLRRVTALPVTMIRSIRIRRPSSIRKVTSWSLSPADSTAAETTVPRNPRSA